MKTFAAAGSAKPGWFQTAGMPSATGSGDLGDMIFTAAQVGGMFPGGGVSGGDLNVPNLDLPNTPGMPNRAGLQKQVAYDLPWSVRSDELTGRRRGG
jgi:hypothetical protein